MVVLGSCFLSALSAALAGCVCRGLALFGVFAPLWWPCSRLFAKLASAPRFGLAWPVMNLMELECEREHMCEQKFNQSRLILFPLQSCRMHLVDAASSSIASPSLPKNHEDTSLLHIDSRRCDIVIVLLLNLSAPQTCVAWPADTANDF